MKPQKYPSTPYLPFSPSLQPKAHILNPSKLKTLKSTEIVVTEKLDGEIACLYKDYWHPRSLTYSPRIDRNYVTKLHGNIKYLLPDTMCIIGENLWAVHTIEYSKLPDWFLVFAVIDEGFYLSWKGVTFWANLLNLKTVPVLYEGSYKQSGVNACFTGKSVYGGLQEGFILRNRGSFEQDSFGDNVAKFVRKNHVQPNSAHWISKPIVANKLIK